MLDSIFAPATDRLRDALNMETARQRVTAHNLANVNTPGFKARRLFRETLEATLDEFGLDSKLSKISDAKEDGFEITESSDPPVRPDGNNVNLESELTDLADIELRYRALSGMTTRYFRGLHSVIAGDGR